MPRRPLLRAGGALALALSTAALAACGGSTSETASTTATDSAAAGGSNAGKVLRVGLYGGTWLDAVKDTAAKAFTEATGAKVEYVEGNPSDLATRLYASAAQNAEPPMDVIETDSLTQEQLVGRELLAPTADYTSNVSDVFADVTAAPLNEGYAPPHCDWYVVLAYNTDKYKELGLKAPTSWSDLWDKKLAGHVSIPDISVAQSTATIAGAAGAATNDPTDYAAGVKKLSQLDTYSIYKASSDMQADMANGNVWVAASSDGRAWQLVDDNQPIKVVYADVPGTDKKGPKAGQCFLDVVKGSKNTDLAAEFIKASYSPEVQAAFAKETGFTPTSPAAIETLREDPKWTDRIIDPTTVLDIDWATYAPQSQKVVDDFSRSFGG
jgi:putative spermidine/putrescine transport system substrate-binding protein